jgi:molecular chaperone GrpE
MSDPKESKLDSENHHLKSSSTDTNHEEMNNNENKEVEQLRQSLEKAKNDFLYLRAEFDTYKRNALKENFDLRKYGAEKFVADLLGVIDNFERALDTQINSENWPQFVKGIEMTAGELKSLLGKHGVQELACLGQAFDPQTQEALGQEASPAPAGHVTRVFRKPYKMHDKLIRPGQVIVSNGSPGEGGSR